MSTKIARSWWLWPGFRALGNNKLTFLISDTASDRFLGSRTGFPGHSRAGVFTAHLDNIVVRRGHGSSLRSVVDGFFIAVWLSYVL